jgi:hypothetical protein
MCIACIGYSLLMCALGDGRAAVLKESIFPILVENLESEDEYLVVKTACAIVLRCFSKYRKLGS